MPSSVTPVRESSPLKFPHASLEDLRSVRLFRALPVKTLQELDGRVFRASYGARETILDLPKKEQLFSYFFFLSKGQVRVMGLDEEARAKPLNFLRKGEFFVDKSFSWRAQVATKVVAITAVELLVVPRKELQALAFRVPPLQEALRALSGKIDYRNRTFTEDKYARTVLDFLIGKELTQGSRVKITEMDKCIECNICYTSCEERHGLQRIVRGYARFGILDFAHSCITCFYPACIPSCPVDSVVFDRATGEVTILDTCIGCSACETACQYGAIKMYKVDATDRVYARFLAGNKKIKPKFVADKCDHCAGYDDLACISNCPTGAIVEVSATDLLENPRIFGAGEGVRKPLPSLIQRGWLDLAVQRLYIALCVLGTLFLTWEALALTRRPALSLLAAARGAGWLAADTPLSFERGSPLCNFYGNLGFALIFLALVYPLRKAFPRLFKYLGREPAWLDFHNACGFLGTVLVIFHTGFAFPLQPSTFGLLALLLVTLSGVFGRFLYQVMPRGVAGTELKMNDIEEEDAALTRKLDALFEESDRHQEFVKKVVASITAEAKRNPTLFTLIRSIVRTWALLWMFRIRLPKEIRVHKRQIGVFLELLRDKIRLQRNAAFLSLSSRMFARWRYIHQPFAWVMLAVALGHIIFNLRFFAW